MRHRGYLRLEKSSIIHRNLKSASGADIHHVHDSQRWSDCNRGKGAQRLQTGLRKALGPKFEKFQSIFPRERQ